MTIERLTDEQIAAIRDGTVGVTPGPWAYVPHHFSDGSIKRRSVCVERSKYDWIDLISDLNNALDAAHIARCDPGAIRAAMDELLESRAALAAKDAEIERLTKERDAADATAEAHEAKWKSICKAERSDSGACSCSYDQPGDVCFWHSPKLAEAEACIARLEAEDTATRNALGPRFTLVPPDGGDVKTHEGASAAMQTLALLEADAVEYRAQIATITKERDEARAEIAESKQENGYVIGWNSGWDEAFQRLKFPTMLRKMWGGGEVQRWLDERRAEQTGPTPGSLSERMFTAEARVAELEEALRGLLACPAIADGGSGDPAWGCAETQAAESRSREALGRDA